MMQYGFYPLNDSMGDPNVRGESPEGFVIVKDVAVGALTAGKATVTLTNIPFGKGLGEVWGAEIIAGADAGRTLEGGSESDLNVILVVGTVALGSGAGEVDVDIVSISAESTAADYVVSLKVYGKILPLNA